jgi:hypothetical protein
MKKKDTRRDFLKKMALTVGSVSAASPLELMVRSTLYGQHVNAMAQEGGLGNPRRYVFIQQGGGPSRWFFDLPLILSEADKGKANLNNYGLATKFADGAEYTDTEYATWKDPKTGLELPWIWQFKVPTPGGGERPMTDLLDHMLIMRGVNVVNPAHNGASVLHFHPAGINHSITSFSSDLANYPISCVNVGSNFHSYISQRGLAHVDLPGRGKDQLKVLMEPFANQNLRKIASSQSSVKDIVQGAKDVFDAFAMESHIGLAASVESRKGAEEMIKSGLANVDGFYNDTFAKYQSIIDRVIQGTYEGINDKKIKNSYNRDTRMTGVYAKNSDFRTLINSKTDIANLAAHFTTAEFILRHNISNSVVIAPGTLDSLDHQNSTASSWQDYYNQDAHSSGRFAHVLCQSFYYMGYAACLLEFIDSLKAAGIFNETVIDLCGEFGRQPRHDNGSNDHAPEANSNTLFCGAIEGPHIIGNISKGNGAGSTYPGTWGWQGNNPEVGYLSIKHFAATLAYMVRAPSPVNVPSLVKEENGKIIPILPTGKIVDS